MPRSSRPRLQQLEDRSVPSAVSGTVFADINLNGARDAGEPGLPLAIVHLDLFGDGVNDLFAATDPGGGFVIPGVPDGTHTLTVVPPVGTAPLGSSSRAVTVEGGVEVGGLTLAVRPEGSVSGVVFADLNGNGQHDPGEPGVAGAAVSLDLLADGVADLTAVTKTDGSYSFANVPDGTHVVGVVPPVNYFAAGANARHAVVAAGSAAGGLDFALRPASAVSGKVLFADVSPGRPGIAGVPVQIDLHGDGTVDATTTTDKTGTFLFANVPNGMHTITVSAPAGAVFNVPANSNKITTIVNSDVKGGLNFGVLMPGSATAGLFLDLNKNGVRDPGERGLTPARVQLDLYNSGSLVDLGANMTGDGTFVVGGLPDGTHGLVITPEVGYASAAPIRSTITITNGSQAKVAPAGVESLSGSTLAVGHGMTGNVQTYSFTPAPNGALTPVPGRTVHIPSKSAARVVMADFTGNGVDEIITATGPGEPARVRVYDGVTGAELVPGGIAVFELSYTGGLHLAAGDFNRDGKADIVVSADVSGGPRVQVLDAAQFQAGADPSRGPVLADFFGIADPNFRGGARTAVGDLNGDGVPDLVVAAGHGGGPRVAVFDGRTVGRGFEPARLMGDFFVFESSLRNGAHVAVGDVNGDGKGDLVAGAGPGGAPRVAVFSGAGVLAGQGINAPRIADFFVTNDTKSRTGTRVTVKDVDRDGRADIVATTNSRAYVYTAAGIRAYQLTPLPGMTGPGASAGVIPFGDAAGTVSVG
jgi:hypothetical protein